MQAKPTHAYVFRCRQCNQAIGSVVDLRVHRHSAANMVSEAIKDGYIVQREEFGSYAIPFDDCGHDQSQEPLPLFNLPPQEEVSEQILDIIETIMLRANEHALYWRDEKHEFVDGGEIVTAWIHKIRQSRRKEE